MEGCWQGARAPFAHSSCGLWNTEETRRGRAAGFGESPAAAAAPKATSSRVYVLFNVCGLCIPPTTPTTIATRRVVAGPRLRGKSDRQTSERPGQFRQTGRETDRQRNALPKPEVYSYRGGVLPPLP